MKIFHFHPETGALLSEGKADPSPLENNVWLIPAHATAIEPPEPSDGEQAVWVDSAWQMQPIPDTEPAPGPDPVSALTTEQKLKAVGLTVAELRKLFGLPAPDSIKIAQIQEEYAS